MEICFEVKLKFISASESQKALEINVYQQQTLFSPLFLFAVESFNHLETTRKKFFAREANDLNEKSFIMQIESTEKKEIKILISSLTSDRRLQKKNA
jgi:hypothetical protein